MITIESIITHTAAMTASGYTLDDSDISGESVTIVNATDPDLDIVLRHDDATTLTNLIDATSDANPGIDLNLIELWAIWPYVESNGQ